MGLSKLITRDWPTSTLMAIGSFGAFTHDARTDTSCACAPTGAANIIAAQASNATNNGIRRRVSMVLSFEKLSVVSCPLSVVLRVGSCRFHLHHLSRVRSTTDN